MSTKSPTPQNTTTSLKALFSAGTYLAPPHLTSRPTTVVVVSDFRVSEMVSTHSQRLPRGAQANEVDSSSREFWLMAFITLPRPAANRPSGPGSR